MNPEVQLQLIPNEIPVPMRHTIHLSDLPDNLHLHSPAPDAAFIESVRRFGILQPVILECQENSGDYLVRAGRRRIKAARIVGVEQIEACIYEAGTFTTGAVELIENQQRSDNPISDLEAIETMLADGASENQICAELGMNRLTLKRRLKLRDLIPDLRAELLAGRMKPSTAEAAASLSPDQQQRLYDTSGDTHSKITHKHLHEIKSARAVEAFASLPAELFDPLPLLGGGAGQGGAQQAEAVCLPPGPPSDTARRLLDLLTELDVWKADVLAGPQRPVKAAVIERLDFLIGLYSKSAV